FRRDGVAGFVAQTEQLIGPLPADVREEWLASDAEALAAGSEATATTLSLETELPKVQLPALIYCGDQDCPHAAATRAAALMPQPTSPSLQGLNHAQALQRRDLVLPHLRALHALVASVTAGGG